MEEDCTTQYTCLVSVGKNSGKDKVAKKWDILEGVLPLPPGS